MIKFDTIGRFGKVPESMQEQWGGEFGCPVKKGGKIIGYVDHMPSDLSDEEEVLKSFMPFKGETNEIFRDSKTP